MDKAGSEGEGLCSLNTKNQEGALYVHRVGCRSGELIISLNTRMSMQLQGCTSFIERKLYTHPSLPSLLIEREIGEYQNFRHRKSPLSF